MIQIGRREYDISDELADNISEFVKDLDYVQSKAMRAAINLRMDRIAAENREKFPVGSRASFVHSKTGEMITGTVTKHNSENTKLLTTSGEWRVSREMLIEPPEGEADGDKD